MDTSPKAIAKRARWWKRFWDINFLLSIVLYFVLDVKVLLLYTMLLSVYANRESAAATEQAAEARDS